jgi:hypothetical protein
MTRPKPVLFQIGASTKEPMLTFSLLKYVRVSLDIDFDIGISLMRNIKILYLF